MAKIHQEIENLVERISDVDGKLYDVTVLMSDFQDYDDITELKAEIRGVIHDLQSIRKELY